MSLDTTATNTETGKKQDLILEEQAKEFSKLVWQRNKSGALKYYENLTPEGQGYIQLHYKLDLKAATMGSI